MNETHIQFAYERRLWINKIQNIDNIISHAFNHELNKKIGYPVL